jgi:glycosyltransferase involved in cell wall biosynthesis
MDTAMISSTPVKVVYLIGQLAVGGGERQLYLLLKGMDRDRFVPTVITFNPDLNEYWEEPIRALGVPLLGVPRSWNKLWRLWALTALLRRIQPHVVHSWELRLNCAAAIAGRIVGVPIRIGSLRCNLYRRGRSEWERRLGTVGLDSIIANSSKGRQDLVRLGSEPNRVEVAFNAVETQKARMTAAERALIRQNWGVDENIVIATIGNLSYSKNYPLLIEVTHSLVNAGWPVKTVVFGDGLLRESLQKLRDVKGLTERFLLMGQDVCAAHLIGAADIFCLTSNSEGMPNVLLEASLAGLPIVSTDVGGARDIIVEEETGYIVPIGDKAALVERLTFLIRNSSTRKRMGRAAQQQIQTDFSLNKITGVFQGIYDRALMAKHTNTL